MACDDVYRTPDDSEEAVWGPQTFFNINLVDGFFNVILGKADHDGPAISEAFGTDDANLGISVDGKEEIRPRQRVLSSPNAIKADRVSCLAPQENPNSVQSPVISASTVSSTLVDVEENGNSLAVDIESHAMDDSGAFG